jgi:hypothetical protein
MSRLRNSIVAFARRACPWAAAAMLCGCNSVIMGDVFELVDAGPEAGPPPLARKVDVLLMIDNSSSMADKQQILAAAVPDLVQRLANPACVNPSTGAQVSQPALPTEDCPAGSSRERSPVRDMHVGVISSSLGGHGADSCADTPTSSYNPHQADMAHLIARGETGDVATWQGKGFLFWDPSGAGSPPGDNDLKQLSERMKQIVVGTGQDGCGFEAPLESWYRFLVDPEPYLSMVPSECATGNPNPNGDCRTPEGVDQVVLTQRNDFLRADSLVMILMLTDEDDCSVKDSNQNYLALQAYAGASPYHLPRATSACASHPSSSSCMSCMMGDHSADPECAKGGYSDLEDSLNLRCYRQKQRFGLDFLQPVSRYVQALTNQYLPNGKVSPLFCRAPGVTGFACDAPMRDLSWVMVAGIVGVPWQDLARDPSDLAKGYKPGSELQWDVIAGDHDQFVDPTDPLMVPSIDARTGANPFTGTPLAAPEATSPTANPINGHEWNIDARNDLQYACVFKLPEPRECASNPISCDCADVSGQHNPLCQADDGSYGTVQYRAKAYPAVRILSVLRQLGSRAVAASICADETSDTASSVYGYRPAVSALIEAVKPALAP